MFALGCLLYGINFTEEIVTIDWPQLLSHFIVKLKDLFVLRNLNRENYVFIVVGDDGDGLSIETKNTIDSLSKYNGPSWDAAEAELRLCRVGQTFNLYKRHVNSTENWISAASFERPDLPQTLQVGLNIYSDSTPDLQIRYDHIKLDHVATATECETP